MNKAGAEKVAREDASPLIRVAKETPLAGTPDPRDLSHIASPQQYVDSPELAARRIATEWEDIATESDLSPPIITKIGRAKEAFDAGEEVGRAYGDALYDELEAHKVLLVHTVARIFVAYHKKHYGQRYSEIDTSRDHEQDLENSYFDIQSLYVIDLARYDQSVAAMDHEGVFLEEEIQHAFAPSDLGERKLKRWKRQRKKKLEALSRQWN